MNEANGRLGVVSNGCKSDGIPLPSSVTVIHTLVENKPPPESIPRSKIRKELRDQPWFQTDAAEEADPTVTFDERLRLYNCTNEDDTCNIKMKHKHCMLCETSLRSPSHQRSHYVIIHRRSSVRTQDGISCLKCKLNHTGTAEYPRPHFHCPFCHKTTIRRFSFERHLLTHLPGGIHYSKPPAHKAYSALMDKLTVCPICSKSVYKNNLFYHLKSIHNLVSQENTDSDINSSLSFNEMIDDILKVNKSGPCKSNSESDTFNAEKSSSALISSSHHTNGDKTVYIKQEVTQSDDSMNDEDHSSDESDNMEDNLTQDGPILNSNTIRSLVDNHTEQSNESFVDQTQKNFPQSECSENTSINSDKTLHEKEQDCGIPIEVYSDTNAAIPGLEFIKPITGYNCILCRSFYHDYPSAVRHCLLESHKLRVATEKQVNKL